MALTPSPSRDAVFTAFRAFLLSVLPSGIEIVQQQDNRVPQPAGVDFVTMNEVGRRRLSANVTTYADCAFTGSVSGATLTVTAVRLGEIAVGATLLGAGVLTGTTIGVQQSGTPGVSGVYALSQAQESPISGVPLACGAALIRQPTEITVQVDVFGPNSADNVATVTTLARDGYAALWFVRQGYDAQGIAILDVEDARQMAFIDGEQQYEDRWSFDVKLQANQVIAPPQDFADGIDIVINAPPDVLPPGVSSSVAPPATGVSVRGPNIVAAAAETAGGFGFVQYAPAPGSAPLLMPAGVRTRLTFAPDPAQTIDELRGPFAGHAFWDGQSILPRAAGDDAAIRLTLTVSSYVIGGYVVADIDIGGTFGTIGRAPVSLTFPAGTPESVTFLFVDYFLATYIANGGAVYLTPSVPITVQSESLVFFPLGAAP